MGKFCQSEAFKELLRFLLCLLTRHTAHIKSQHHILFDCAPWQEQRLLGHVAPLPCARACSIAIDGDHSRTRLIDACHNTEKSAFTTTTLPNHRHNFTQVDHRVNG